MDPLFAEADPSHALVRHFLEHAPVAAAIVSGAAHGCVFTNAEFRRLSADADAYAGIGEPIADALPAGARAEVNALLDRVRRDGVAAHEVRVGYLPGGAGRRHAPAWLCDVWPAAEEGARLDYLVLTMRQAQRHDVTRMRHRALTERLLLTALREQDLARRSDNARARAAFLSETSRRLGASFELATAYAAVATVALPVPGAWSIVDVDQSNGMWRRLAIAHPDPAKEGLARELTGHWSPAPGDPIGVPLIAQSRESTIVAADTEVVLASAAHGPDNLRILRALGLGSLLVVPLIAHDRLRGAITFVSPSGAPPYSSDDVALAEDLAARCAHLLDGARLYDDGRLAQIGADVARTLADTARDDAENANDAKGTVLTSMSHELRTPLNAILGYTELLTTGMRGPVSPDQSEALNRIRRAGLHLLGLINDVLRVARLRESQARFLITDVPVSEVLDAAGYMVAPLALTQRLTLARMPCASALAMHADREKVLQILLNLLANAIRFTAPGGHVTLAAVTVDRRRIEGTPLPPQPAVLPVQLMVSDTGRGIATEQLDAIFEPFVQVGARLVGNDEGTGLGLAISRDLARGMGGDLTVESTPGVGSTFTLTVPCAAA
jgi:signal transduction histidine kinase